MLKAPKFVCNDKEKLIAKEFAANYKNEKIMIGDNFFRMTDMKSDGNKLTINLLPIKARGTAPESMLIEVSIRVLELKRKDEDH